MANALLVARAVKSVAEYGEDWGGGYGGGLEWRVRVPYFSYDIQNTTKSLRVVFFVGF